MPETAWRPDPTLLKELADETAPRLKGNPLNRVAIFRAVIRANPKVPKEHRNDCISPIAEELNMRGHIKRAMNRPDAPPSEPTARPAKEQRAEQTGFGFGEALHKPETKLRPPTRRHL